MNKAQLMYTILELVIFFIPVGALIWKAAKQSGRIEELEKDLHELAHKVEATSEDHRLVVNEINKNITSLTIAISNINTSLEYIKKSIEEVKK